MEEKKETRESPKRDEYGEFEAPLKVTMKDLYRFIKRCVDLSQKSRLSLETIKYFYKMRHNALYTLMCSECGLPLLKERKIKLDNNYESRLTPDWWFEYPDKIIIIEISFTNKYDSSMANKKYLTKYSQLRSDLNTIKPTDVFYVVYSYDTGIGPVIDTFNAIVRRIHNRDYASTEAVQDFFSEMWTLNVSISELLPEMNYGLSGKSNFPEIVPPLKEIPIKFPVEGVPRKSSKQLRVANLLNRTRGTLMKALKNIPLDRPSCIIFDEDKQTLNIGFYVGDASANDLKFMISSNDLDGLMKTVRTKKGSLVSGDNIPSAYQFLNRYGDSDKYDPYIILEEKERETRSDHIKSAFLWYNRRRDDRGLLTLTDYPLTHETVSDIRDYSLILRKNKVSDPSNNFYQKSPFIFYPSSPDYGDFDEMWFEEIKNKFDGFDRSLFDRISRQISSTGIQEYKTLTSDYDEKKFFDASKRLTSSGKSLKSVLGNKFREEIKKVLPLTNLLLIDRKFEIKKNQRKRKKLTDRRKELIAMENSSNSLDKLMLEYLKAKADIIMAQGSQERKIFKNKVVMNIRYTYKKEWSDAMAHFSRVEKGVDQFPNTELRTDECRDILEELFNDFFDPMPDPPDDVFIDTQALGFDLSNTCEQMKSLGKEHLKRYKETRLAHYYLFTSRLCYSLGFLSMIRSNKDDFLFDNLGYKNCLLIVKGGKKIHATRRSRLFKVLIPLTDVISGLMPNREGYKKVNIRGLEYISTPWRQLNMTFLKQGVEIYFRSMNYLTCSYIESGLSVDDHRRFCFLKILCSFNQRRKLEIWTGFLRYFYFNTTGTHANLKKLLEDMIVQETDIIFSVVQTLFCNRLLKIYENSQLAKIYDFLFDTIYDNFDLCSERFDESILMAKAPFESMNEHLINIKSIIDTHRVYVSKVGNIDPDGWIKMKEIEDKSGYYNASDPFHCDLDLCFNCGSFGAEKLLQFIDKSELESSFKNIMDTHFTTITTSKGMRKDDLNDFWGLKGHDVVFGDMIKKDITELRNFLRDKKISEKSYDLESIILNNPNYRMLFDAKDKEQRKGSREIYVMSMYTKVYQNPLERFFKELCRHFPNELIHIPHDQRSKRIHSKVFDDNPDEIQLNSILDCRRWAPQSNLWKYYYFIKGMKSALPESFMNYFEFVWGKMLRKCLVIQPQVIEKLKTSPGYSDIEEFVYREGEAFLLPMPYSFMMGIFNYLSSLMHACSQLYFSETIARKIGVKMEMFAHSDDSGGRVVATSLDKALDCYRIYEIFQLDLNHMLSQKKSALSLNSFEIISIMYMNKRLIPMTHKFISNLGFEPTGNGWQSDAAAAASKVIEVHSNGGTLVQSYLTMLSYNEMIRKFYHIPKDKMLSHIPLAAGGVLDIFPLHIIQLGVAAQNCLLEMWYGPKFERLVLSGETLFGKRVPVLGFYSSTSPVYFARHENSYLLDQFDADEIKLMDALSTSLRSDALTQFMRYIVNLKNPTFVNSLMKIDTKRLMLYTMYTKNRLIIEGEMDLRRCSTLFLAMAYDRTLDLHNTIDDFELPTFDTEAYSYLKHTEKIKFDLNSVSVPSTKTCKPEVYELYSVVSLPVERGMLNKVIGALLDERTLEYLHDGFVVDNVVKWVKEKYEDITIQELISLLQKNEGISRGKRIGVNYLPSYAISEKRQRYWANSVLYNMRRNFISSVPPFQLPDLTSLMNTDLSNNLRLHTFIWNLITDPNIDMEDKESIVEESEMPKEFKRFYRSYLNSKVKRFTPEIPFAIYDTPQRRLGNVWYGSAEFTLYWLNNNIKQTFIGSVVRTEWTLQDTSIIPEFYEIYSLFCETRGIPKASQSLINTGPRNDLIAITSSGKAQHAIQYSTLFCLENTRFTLTPLLPQQVRKNFDNELVLNDNPIDIAISSTETIDLTLLKEKNLINAYNKRLAEYQPVDFNFFSDNAFRTKLYNLFCEYHYIDTMKFDETYNEKPNLLGSQGSLSYTLTSAALDRRLRYQTSVKKFFIPNTLENISHVGDIPVMDLYRWGNLGNLYRSERIAINKLLEEGEVSEIDYEIIKKGISRAGLGSIETSIVLSQIESQKLFKYILSQSTDRKREFMRTVVQIICTGMKQESKNEGEGWYQGSRQSYYKIMRLLLSQRRIDKVRIGILLYQGLFRSYMDNVSNYKVRADRNDILRFLDISLEKPESLKHLFSLLSEDFLDNFFEEYSIDYKRRGRRIPKFRDPEILNPHYKQRYYGSYLLDEDSLDAISMADDFYEEPQVRTFSGTDTFEAEIYSMHQNASIAEYLSDKEFSNIKLKYLVQPELLGFLGPYNKRSEEKEGITWVVMEYPGNTVGWDKSEHQHQMDFTQTKFQPNKKIEPYKEKEETESRLLNNLKTNLNLNDRELEILMLNYREIIEPIAFNLNESIKRIMGSDTLTKLLNARKNEMKMRSRKLPPAPHLTNLMDDSQIKAELESIWGQNYYLFLTGHASLTENSYKLLTRSLRRLIKNKFIDKGRSATALLCLMCLKDTIDNGSSDSWVYDRASEIINEIDDYVSKIEEEQTKRLSKEDEEDETGLFPIPEKQENLFKRKKYQIDP